MPRKVFFSFHYQRDAVRAAQVRNSNVVVNYTIETSDFINGARWESLKRTGDAAVKRWIASQLYGTSVTVVLIGAQTAERRWVNYEIEESIKRGNGLLGIYIHNCPLFDKSCDSKGRNPFDSILQTTWEGVRRLSASVRTYDWIADQGRINLGTWIETAARQARK